MRYSQPRGIERSAGDSPQQPSHSHDVLQLHRLYVSILCVMLQVKRYMVVCRALLCLLYTSPSPRDATLSRMPSSA